MTTGDTYLLREHQTYIVIYGADVNYNQIESTVFFNGDSKTKRNYINGGFYFTLLL